VATADDSINKTSEIRRRLFLAAIHCGIGTLLLLLTFAGQLWRHDSVQEESPVRKYWEELRIGKAFELSEASYMVFSSTTHDSPRYLSFHENWVQWLLSRVYKPLRRTQDTALLIDGGRAECSERSQILKSIAEDCGYRCRFVGLGGHVVLEVEMDSQWYVADPEFGLAFPFDAEQLCQKSHTDYLRHALKTRAVSDAHVDDYLLILQSTDNNRRLPIGEPISPRLHSIEQACQWLAWIIPLAFLFSSFGFLLGLRGPA
jgi:hypothetical protein